MLHLCTQNPLRPDATSEPVQPVRSRRQRVLSVSDRWRHQPAHTPPSRTNDGSDGKRKMSGRGWGEGGSRDYDVKSDSLRDGVHKIPVYRDSRCTPVWPAPPNPPCARTTFAPFMQPPFPLTVPRGAFTRSFPPPFFSFA